MVVSKIRIRFPLLYAHFEPHRTTTCAHPKFENRKDSALTSCSNTAYILLTLWRNHQNISTSTVRLRAPIFEKPEKEAKGHCGHHWSFPTGTQDYMAESKRGWLYMRCLFGRNGSEHRRGNPFLLS